MVCAYVFGEEQVRKIFRQNQGATKFDLRDAIKLECQVYQTTHFTVILYGAVRKRENRTCYWRSAYGVAGIDLGWEN